MCAYTKYSVSKWPKYGTVLDLLWGIELNYKEKVNMTAYR